MKVVTSYAAAEHNRKTLVEAARSSSASALTRSSNWPGLKEVGTLAEHQNIAEN